MVYGVDKKGKSKDIGEKNELLYTLVSMQSIIGRGEGCLCTCRNSSHFWPTAVKNRRPSIHSLLLSLVSLAKSCKWVTSLSARYLALRSGQFAELILMTLWVMLSTVRFFIGRAVAAFKEPIFD